MGAPIAPKWIKSASSTANAKTLENTADGGYQEVDALSADVKAALTGASSPSAENPFATLAEAGGTSVVQTFTATASQTVFDASSIWPTGTYALAVFRNGLYQTLTTDYTVDGTEKTVTFVAACTEGDIVNVIFNAPVAALPIPESSGGDGVGGALYLYNRMGGF